MYIIYTNIWSKNYALYNIKNSINNKSSNHCVNNDFTNTFLVAQMQSLTLAGSPEFQIKSLPIRLCYKKKTS